MPNKTLLSLSGKMVIEHIIERCKRSIVDDVIIATTPREEDRILCQIALSHGCKLFIGDERDVAKRVRDAARLYEVDIIVRVTQDCPCVDPEIVNKTIDLVRIGNASYGSSRLDPGAYPDGYDVEVVRTDVFEVCHEFEFPVEHIMNPVLDKAKIDGRVVIAGLPRYVSSVDLAKLRCCIDTIEDYLFVKKLFDHFQGKMFGWRDFVDYYYSNERRIA